MTWQGKSSKPNISHLLSSLSFTDPGASSNPSKPQTCVYEGEQNQTFQEDSGHDSILSKTV